MPSEELSEQEKEGLRSSIFVDKGGVICKRCGLMFDGWPEFFEHYKKAHSTRE